MISEHDSVYLLRNIREFGLLSGDIGVVVHIHEDAKAYEVEFMTLDGKTMAVCTLNSEDIDVAHAGMIPHVRQIAV